MLSRRDLVGKLAAGTAAVVAVGAAGTSWASARRAAGTATRSGNGEGRFAAAPKEPVSAPEVTAPLPQGVNAGPPIVDSGPAATLSAPPPWELLRPLAMGSVVAHGWHVAGLTGAVDGSCVLTLENERGRAHRVHLCRNDGRPNGLVYTKRVDLVVMNGGQGDLPTEEGLAQAVAEVAHVLAANERQGLVAELLPQRERVRMFAGPVDRRLR